MENSELTEKIIGCAFRIYNKMGFGFSESVYERCMLIELRRCGLSVDSQIGLHVRYEGEIVGDFIVDLLVEGEVIVELKSVKSLVIAHEAQLVNYLVATGKDFGLLINFGESRVEVKRKHRIYKKRTDPEEE